MPKSGHPASVTARRRSSLRWQPGSWTPSEDNKGLHLLQPVMLNDLKLPAQHMVRLGGRAWVSFDHGSEPLAAQVYRYSRQLFLARFSPAL